MKELPGKQIKHRRLKQNWGRNVNFYLIPFYLICSAPSHTTEITEQMRTIKQPSACYVTGIVPDVHSSRKRHSRGDYHPDFNYGSKETQTGRRALSRFCQG